MTSPALVTPPVLPVVSLSDLKDFLVVEDDERDALIQSLADAAVARLDGPEGILGRAIMPQTWRQEFTGPGPHLLALPDVTEVTATADAVAVPLTEARDGARMAVTAEGVTGSLVVTYTCALPDRRLPMVQTAVKMMVAHWFKQREPVVVGTTTAEVPQTVDALIVPLRWSLL